MRVLEANVQDGAMIQFEQETQEGLDFGPYDTQSVMHYDSFAFSRNKEPTLTKLDGGLIVLNERASPGDIATVASPYGGHL